MEHTLLISIWEAHKKFPENQDILNLELLSIRYVMWL